MRRLLYPSVLAVMAGLASGNANAVDVFDWSGFYVGGAVGVVQSGGSADIVTDGSFAGPVYDYVAGYSPVSLPPLYPRQPAPLAYPGRAVAVVGGWNGVRRRPDAGGWPGFRR